MALNTPPESTHAETHESTDEQAVEQMSVEASQHGAAVVVAVSGELDLATGPALQQALLGALLHRPQRVVVDLEKLTYLDSIGLGLLVSFQRRTAADGVATVLICSDPHCRKIFAVTGLDSFFTFSPDLATALAGDPPAPPNADAVATG